jgi:hypothetical protein
MDSSKKMKQAKISVVQESNSEEELEEFYDLIYENLDKNRT